MCARKAWPAATCRSTTRACAADTNRDWVRPATARVRLWSGPWRAVGSVAHAQPGLLHVMNRSDSDPRRMGWGGPSASNCWRTGDGNSGGWGMGSPFG